MDLSGLSFGTSYDRGLPGFTGLSESIVSNKREREKERGSSLESMASASAKAGPTNSEWLENTRWRS